MSEDRICADPTLARHLAPGLAVVCRMGDWSGAGLNEGSAELIPLGRLA